MRRKSQPNPIAMKHEGTNMHDYWKLHDVWLAVAGEFVTRLSSICSFWTGLRSYRKALEICVHDRTIQAILQLAGRTTTATSTSRVEETIAASGSRRWLSSIKCHCHGEAAGKRLVQLLTGGPGLQGSSLRWLTTWLNWLIFASLVAISRHHSHQQASSFFLSCCLQW
jgi:hypothetical protein